MNAIAVFIVGLVLWFPVCLLRGWAVVRIWDWFGAPQFPNLWHPNIYSAVGIVLVVSSLVPHRVPPPTAEQKRDYPFWDTIGAIIFPLGLVAFGGLWHWIMGP